MADTERLTPNLQPDVVTENKDQATTQTDQKTVAGPGLTALEKLLVKGKPDLKAVIALLDNHPGEHAVLFARLQETCGNAYVSEVEKEMGHLRVNWDKKDLIAGDPTKADSNYFIGGAGEKGVRWRAADGDFTGKIDEKGLTSDANFGKEDETKLHIGADFAKANGGLSLTTKDGDKQREIIGLQADAKGLAADVNLGEHGGTNIHATGDFANKSGEISLNTKDGDQTTQLGKISGQYTDEKNFKADAHTDFGVGRGKMDIDAGYHQVDGAGHIIGGVAYGDKETKGSLSADVGLDGSSKVGLVGSHDLGDKKSLAGNVDVETKEGKTTTSGDLAYKTADGELGLKGSYASADENKLVLRQSHQNGEEKTGQTLGVETKDGKSTLSSTADFADEKTKIGVKTSSALDGSMSGVNLDASTKLGGSTLSFGAGQELKGDKETNSLALGLETKELGLKGSGSYTSADENKLAFDGRLTNGDATHTLSLGREEKEGKSTYSGALGFADPDTKLNLGGSFTDSDNLKLGASGSQGFEGDRTLAGNVDFARADGKNALDLGLKYTDIDKVGEGDKAKSFTAHQLGFNFNHTDEKDAAKLSYLRGWSPDQSLALGLGFNRSADEQRLTLDGEYKDKGLTLGGQIAGWDKGAAGQGLDLAFNQGYKSDKLVESFGATGSFGPDATKLGLTGSLDAQLAKNLYLSTYGSFNAEKKSGDPGWQPTYSLGAGLTFTPAEWGALTAAGIVNQDGSFEARLQFDVFKGKVSSLSTLTEQKKKALMSFFVSFSHGQSGMFGDRFGGAPNLGNSWDVGGRGGNQIGVGVSFHF